jgi:hypothetical protein
MNPGVENKVWGGQLRLYCRAINEASIVHLRADHDTVKSKHLHPKTCHLKILKYQETLST